MFMTTTRPTQTFKALTISTDNAKTQFKRYASSSEILKDFKSGIYKIFYSTRSAHTLTPKHIECGYLEVGGIDSNALKRVTITGILGVSRNFYANDILKKDHDDSARLADYRGACFTRSEWASLSLNELNDFLSLTNRFLEDCIAMKSDSNICLRSKIKSLKDDVQKIKGEVRKHEHTQS